MRKIVLCLAALLLSSCGDDLGWEQKVNTKDADCYDSSEIADANEVCNLCQDATEVNDNDTTGLSEDSTSVDQDGGGSDSGNDDVSDAGVGDDVPDSQGDVTETTDVESDTGTDGDTQEEVVVPPECATPTDCADSNPCTDDGCEVGKCVHLANSGTCTDGDECTGGDTCQLDKCVPGIAINCDDLNPCTDDSCDAVKGCVHLPNTATCTDDDKCTDSDVCAEGKCIPGALINCDDTDPCTTDSCAPAASCVHAANTEPCDDGDVCTVGDKCVLEGSCKPGVAKDCNDNNPCTDDSCDKVLGCVHLANVATCSDGNACTLDDVCFNAQCAGKPAFCDDGQVCTDDSCDPAIGCVNLANASTCTDGDDCTLDDKCAEGKCKPGDLMQCPSATCVISSCEKGKCVDDKTMLNDVKCDDGNLCTTLAKCLDGKCLQVSDKICDDGNVCTVESCDKDTGKCKAVPSNVVECVTGNMCTVNDFCKAGTCQGGPAPDCNDKNPCTKDGCAMSSGCFHDNLPDGTSCTVGICQAGQCSCPSGFGCAAPKFSYTNDSNAGMIGGMGGGVGPKMGCADTDVLIGLGFDFSNGTKTATRTTAVCGVVKVAPDGTVSTTQTSTQKSGGSGCFGWDPSVQTPLTVCPSGWAVVGLKALKTGSTLFNSVTVVCGKLGTSGKWSGEKQDLVVPGMPGTGAAQEIACPPESIARYFETRAGCGQDALTMYCAVPTPDCTGQDLICKDVL